MDDYERNISDIVNPNPDTVGGPPKVEDVHLATPDTVPAVDPLSAVPDETPPLPAGDELVDAVDKPAYVDPAFAEPSYNEPTLAERMYEAEEAATDTYVHVEAVKTKRGPTADDIKNYRLGDEKPEYTPAEPNKYNLPRSSGDPARQSPNLRMGMAIASFVLGILSFALFWIPYFGFVTPVLAILFGAIGLVQSQSQPEYFGGRGFAIAGIVLGLICLGLAFLTLSVLGCVVDWFRAMFQVR